MEKNKEVLISIILPTCKVNQSKKAIVSLLNQEYSNKEILVINDNPSIRIDLDTLNFFKKNKIKLINNKINLGIAGSMNVGIKHSNSNILILTNDDYFPETNLWLNHVVEKLCSDRKIACVLSNTILVKEDWMRCNFLTKIFNFRYIALFIPGGGNYKKDVLEKVGLFNSEEFKFAGEDCDMHLRIKKKGFKIAYIKDVVFHKHYDQQSNFLKIIKKEFGYGVGHGALKRKYGISNRIGLFDFEIRVLLIFGFVLNLFFNHLLSILFLIPFFLSTITQSIQAYSRTKWLPGLLIYPFTGMLIIFVQTIGAIKGYFWSGG